MLKEKQAKALFAHRHLLSLVEMKTLRTEKLYFVLKERQAKELFARIGIRYSMYILLKWKQTTALFARAHRQMLSRVYFLLKCKQVTALFARIGISNVCQKRFAIFC